MVVKTFQGYSPTHTIIELVADWTNLLDNLDVIIDWTTQKVKNSAISWTNVNSSINPSVDITYGLGSPTKRWLGACVKNIYTDGINFPSNGTPDTNLYRDGAGMLRTDYNMTIVGNLTVYGTINAVGGEGETPTVLANLEITNLLTIDSLQLFKDTGNVISSGVPTNVATPSGNYTYLFATVISPIDHVTPLTDIMLMTNQAFFVEKDIQTFGFFGTSSDPYKEMGGGAILQGQGFTGKYCPPIYSLVGTLATGTYGSYPSGTYATMIALPSPENMQYYYTTDTHCLYQYITDTWTLMFSDVYSDDYDTLFLIRGDETDNYNGANLWLGRVNTNYLTIRAPSNATVTLTEGINAGIRYMYPDGSNKTWGIGSTGHYLKFVDTDDIFVNRLMPLEQSYIIVQPPLSFIDTDLVVYRPTTGEDPYKHSLVVQTLSDGGLIVEQNLSSNTLAVTTNAGIGGQFSLGTGSAISTLVSGFEDPYTYIYPTTTTVGLGSATYPFRWADVYDMYVFNLLTIGNGTSATSFGMGYSDPYRYLIPDDTNVGLGSDTYYFRWVDAYDVFAIHSLNLGTGTSAISLTAGIDAGIRYFMPDGSNKTVGLGSTGHYLKFVNTDDVFVNRLMPLEQSYIIIQPPLEFADSDVVFYRPTTGSDANKHSLRLQTLSDGGLIIEQNLSANILTLSVATGTAPIGTNSTTVCNNLNADMLDNYHASDFLLAAGGDIIVSSVMATAATGYKLGLAGGTTYAALYQDADWFKVVAYGNRNIQLSTIVGYGVEIERTLIGRGITQIATDSVSPDTANYASFGVTRLADNANNSYIGLTKSGTVAWGIGIGNTASSHSLIFGLAASGRTITSPIMKLDNTGNLTLGGALRFIDNTYLLYKHVDGSIHLETPVDTGMNIEQNLNVGKALAVTQYISSAIVTGTQPIQVVSETKCDHLNADLLDDHHASDFIVSGGDVQFNSVTITNIAGLKLGVWAGDIYSTLSWNDSTKDVTLASHFGNLLLSSTDDIHLNADTGHIYIDAASSDGSLFISGGSTWQFRVYSDGDYYTYVPTNKEAHIHLGSDDSNSSFNIENLSWSPVFRIFGNGNGMVAGNFDIGKVLTFNQAAGTWAEIHTNSTYGIILNYNTGTQKIGSCFQICDGLTAPLINVHYTGITSFYSTNTPVLEFRTQNSGLSNACGWLDFYNYSGSRQWLVGMSITANNGHFELFPYAGGNVISYADMRVEHADSVYAVVNSTNSGVPNLILQKGGADKLVLRHYSGNAYLSSSEGAMYLAGSTVRSQNDFVAEGLLTIQTTYPSLYWNDGGGVTKLAIGWNGSEVAFTGQAGNMLMTGAANIILAPASGYNVYLWGGRHLIPQSPDGGQIGETGYYFNKMYSNWFYGKNNGLFGCEREKSGQEWAHEFNDEISALDFLSHELTKTKYHTKYDDEFEDKIICTCGKSGNEPCPEHLEEWNDKYTVNTGKITQAVGYIALEHAVKIASLELQVSELQEQIKELKLNN